MRILIAAMRFPTLQGETYQTTVLADALARAGHEVEVLHLDWDAPTRGAKSQIFQTANGQRVVRCAPRAIGGAGSLVRHASKFVLSGRHAARVARRTFALETFDALVMWMPALAFGPLVRQAKAAGIRNRLLIVWDFFPDHYREIGRIPFRPAVAAARGLEQALLKDFTAIFCTLPGNAEYLRSNYRLGDSQKVHVMPVWSDISPVGTVDRGAVRQRHGLREASPVAVFGGQFVAGRGFELMLDAADCAHAAGSPLQFLFVGDGDLASIVAARAGNSSNIDYRPALHRTAYLELLGACDVGMVATVPGVSSFSFPSKTADYLRAGLPVATAVEPGSDFVAMLENYRVGGGVAFGEAEGFFRLAERLAGRGDVGSDAQRCLAEVFDIAHAVSTLTRAMA